MFTQYIAVDVNIIQAALKMVIDMALSCMGTAAIHVTFVIKK